MKKILTLSLSLLALLGSSNVNGQKVFNIRENSNISSNNIPEQCSECIINIKEGVTLTVNKDIYLSNVTINGGTLALDNKKVTYWAPGAFNNVKVNVSGNNGGIISSGKMEIKNSAFRFTDNSKATFWGPVTMTESNMIFLADAGMEVTSNFELKKSSFLQAGNGDLKSKAYVMFNGGTLKEYDDSYVSIANTNNYYFNWNPFNTDNKSYATSFNTINCGTSGKNACSAPMVYGPSTLNFAGVASSAILPVKLTDFAVKLTGLKIDISWITAMEMNSDRFEVERSIDGINWVVAGTVKGKGTTANRSVYTFVDYHKFSGLMNYRLKMIDQDGSFEYSPIRAVTGESIAAVKIYPNPASSYVIISTPNNGASKNTVQLISFSGQVIKQITGSGNINLSLNEVNAGHYFVKVIDANGAAQTFKLMVTK